MRNPTAGSPWAALTRGGLAAPPTSIARRQAAGKALRERLPRRQQGAFAPGRRRGGLVSSLQASVSGRCEGLLPIRWGRMAASPFGFFRGAAAIMAADVGPQRTTGIEVQVCGDAHLLNLGAYGAPDGHLVFDLNDFDETCRGPFEWDLKRLAASLAVAGRTAGHRNRTCAEAVQAFVAAYREHLAIFARMPFLELSRLEVTPRSTAGPLAPIFTKAKRDTPQELLRKVTTSTAGGFARFRSHPPLQRRLLPAEARALLGALSAYRQTIGADRRQVLDAYTPRDLAFHAVGTGSIGLDAYLVLLYGTDRANPLFLQGKQEQPSCWRPYLKGARRYLSIYPHQGRRGAQGQLFTQTVVDPFLGWTRIGSRSYLVRQWSNHRAALDVLMLQRTDVLADYAVLCGRVLAKAHGRTGDGAMLAGYCGSGGSLGAGPK